MALHRASLEAAGPGEPMQLTGTVLLFIADNVEGQCPRLESALSLGIQRSSVAFSVALTLGSRLYLQLNGHSLNT